MIIAHFSQNLNSYIKININKTNSFDNTDSFDESISFLVNTFYRRSISKLVLNNIKCPHCGSNSWYRHGYYKRTVYVHIQILIKVIVKIARIRCRECGKTQAILIEDIIPFYSVLFCYVKKLLLDNSFDFDPYDYYLKKKFKNCFTYKDAVSRFKNIKFLNLNFST